MRHEGAKEKSELSEAAQEEEKLLREQLTEELGYEPTQEELDEWLREHTESY